MSSCPEVAWTVEVSQFSQNVGEVFYTANRNFCLPGVPWDMVRVASSVITVVKEESCGWGEGQLCRWLWSWWGWCEGSLFHPALCLCLCMSPPNPQPVIQSLQQELCPSFLLPSAPGEKLYSFLGQHLVLYSACSNGEARPRERSHRACRAKLELALGLHFALCPLTLPSCAPAECQAPRRDPGQMKLLWVRATF